MKLITDKPDEVQDFLYTALEKLIKNRSRDRAFTDEEEVGKKKYFSTLEGLDSLLIPLVSLDKNDYWGPLKSKYKNLEKIIEEDITFILKCNPTSQSLNPQAGHGLPYFTGEKDVRKKTPFWTSDAASFTLSVLANFLELQEKFGCAKEIEKERVEAVMDINLMWLRTCKEGNEGWAWLVTPSIKAHPWPTWSILDTFEELISYPSTRGKRVSSERECKEVIACIVRKFETDEKLKEALDKHTSYDVNSVFDATRLMLAVSLYEGAMTIYPLAEKLFIFASEADFAKTDYKFRIYEHDYDVKDASLAATIFRTLVTMVDRLGERWTDLLDEKLKQSHRNVLNKVYGKLMESLISEGKYKGLWGVGRQTIYELYFTERTIEALTIFLNVYGKKLASVEPIRTTGKPVAKKPKKPKISSESDCISYIQELVKKKVPRGLRGKPEDLLEDYIFMLFEGVFGLEGTQWGHMKRGKSLPDGYFLIPQTMHMFLYDAKSSSGPYKMNIAEQRKFTDYTQKGKQQAAALGRDLKYFLAIAGSFKGDLKKRASKFEGETGIKLVCMRAEDLCAFAELVKQQTKTWPTGTEPRRIIKWGELFSLGKPVIKAEDIEKIKKDWEHDLKEMLKQ